MRLRSRQILLSRAVRAAAIGITVATIAVSAVPAEAKGGQPLRACSATFSGAQERARSGHLREAKDLYLKCARTTCGGLQRKCATAAEQTSSDIAQVALVVSAADGTALVDVLVKMDGEPLTNHLDGRALPIDPGVHEFTFGARVGEPARFVWLTRKIMVVQGQREPIAVVLPPAQDAEAEPTLAAAVTSRATAADPATEPKAVAEKTSDEHETPPAAPPSSEAAVATPQRHGASPLPWVIGGVGVLGVGAGALLTYWGRADNQALAQCSPDCKPASVEHIHQLYLASDVSFAAGGAAIGLAAILLATSHPHEGSVPSTGSNGASHTAFSFDVQPTRSGAFASVVGAF
jgi:hypothetical protein